MKILKYAILCLTLSTPIAYAAEATIVSLSAQAQREVNNDMTTVSMFNEQSGSDTSKMADQVNRSITRAINKAKSVSGIEVSGGNVRTWANYKNGRQDGWRVNGEIKLSSRNATKLAELTGELQSYLKLDNVSFNVSREKRQQVENELIPEAINLLKSRAKSVANTLGKSRISISELNIGGNGLRVMPYAAKLANDATLSGINKVSAPTWEAGKQTISVEISGKVELR